MKSHELARILLDHPDMPVSVEVDNTTVHNHLALGVSRCFLGGGQGAENRILIGNFHKMGISDSVIVTQVLHGFVTSG